MNEMTRSLTEIAWAAGLFEGEGCITHSGNPETPVLACCMSDLDVMERFVSAVGIGRIRQRFTKEHEHHKTMFEWRIHGDQKCHLVLIKFWPWLGERRRNRALELFTRPNYLLPTSVPPADIDVPAASNTRTDAFMVPSGRTMIMAGARSR
jgi:hypothetical protein